MDSPNIILEMGTDSLGPAFRIWQDHQQRVRGKKLSDVIRTAMRFWVSFAMAEIEAKIPSSGAKIAADLMRPSRVGWRTRNLARTKKRGSASLANRYRDTIAARLVFFLNYKQARLKAAFGDDAGAYGAVAKFVSARRYSAKHHKVSGFVPAMIEFSKYRSGAIRNASGPRYRNSPGSYAQTLDGNAAEAVVAAWPKATQRPGRPAPLGLARMVPGAFEAKENDLSRLFLGFVTKDGLLWGGAKAAGFKVAA
jgi:hypothetical protein